MPPVRVRNSGKRGVGCLMDIPETKGSTSGHLCVAARSSKFMFGSKKVVIAYHTMATPVGKRSANVNHLFLDCSRHCSLNRQP